MTLREYLNMARSRGRMDALAGLREIDRARFDVDFAEIASGYASVTVGSGQPRVDIKPNNCLTGSHC